MNKKELNDKNSRKILKALATNYLDREQLSILLLCFGE